MGKKKKEKKKEKQKIERKCKKEKINKRKTHKSVFSLVSTQIVVHLYAFLKKLKIGTNPI